MAIPIRNIYYLLCYAWNHLEARDLLQMGSEGGDRVEDLLAHVLSRSVSRLLAQGLDQGYVAAVDEIAGIRGKLLVGNTVARLQLHAGRTTCEIDELTVDVPHNRILKATMRELAALDSVDLKLRALLRRQLVRFGGVADVDLDPEAFRSLQLGRNLSRYAFLMQVCALVSRTLLPDPSHGHKRFHAFETDEQEMGTVFESFIFNFLRLEQTAYGVSRRNFEWEANAARESDLAFLPEMRTDVLLTNASRRLIIETKFYAQPLRASRRGRTPKLISGHLYQVLAYLSHLRDEPGPLPEALLLYAGAGAPIDLVYTLRGYRLRVATIDLDAPWAAIEQQLLELVSQAVVTRQ